MKKILIIEDDPFLSEMYATKFAQSGFEVETAFDGKSGLYKAKESLPDLILLDIVLPKMDGFEVLKEIKKEGSSLKKYRLFCLAILGKRTKLKKA